MCAFSLSSALFDLRVLQCDGLKMELQELQILYDSSQRERAELEEELQRCKAELEKLSGRAQVQTRTTSKYTLAIKRKKYLCELKICK